MGRILFYLFIALLIYALFRGFGRSRKRDEAPARPEAKAEDMVQCARCGVNLPRSEALLQSGKLVCLNNPQCHP